MHCEIEVVFSPAREDLNDVPGLLPDPGGFVYRIRTETGGVCISGTSQGLDPLKALSRAKSAAKMAGFTHWRTKNTGGPHNLL